MELKERVSKALEYEATKQEWRNKYGREEFIFCDELNLYLFGKRFNRAEKCECIEDFFLLLHSRLKHKKFEAMAEKKYLYKEGVVVQSHGPADGLNRLSPDEKCVRALAASPKLADNFDRIPDNWKKDVENYKKRQAEAAKKKAAAKAAPKAAEPQGAEGDEPQGAEGDEPQGAEGDEPQGAEGDEGSI